MNNILTFEDYKKMNIKQIENVIYHQFIKEDIKDEVNEGIIRNAINKAAGRFIQTALADEIEKGKELEKSIKDALDGLNKGFDEIEKRIDTKSDKKSKLDAIEKVKEAIKAVQSQTFDTLTMIGSEGEIDFAGFMGSATISAATNFGILFTPIRSLFITRKAYKYFLGIIKQTIRRNLLIIQLNFDQFENLILQKSFETEDDSEFITMSNTIHDVIKAIQEQLCKDGVLFKSKSKQQEMSNWLKDFQKTQDMLLKQNRESDKRNPLSSLWSDQYNNTYTRTLEQIRQYINDDSQKELDSLKNSITKMAGNDVELLPYGELMISAAEEYAIKTNHGINNNFIKMSSVFNLENQKKLIELIVETQKENEAEVNKRENKKFSIEQKKKSKRMVKNGKKIYEEKLKDKSEEYTFDEFEEKFIDDDVTSLKAYFQTDEGRKDFEKLTKEHPIYKYFICNTTTLNTLLSAINNLKVVEMSDTQDFYEGIVKKSQSLYYMMANKAMEDVVGGIKSEDYYGFEKVDKIVVGKTEDTELDPTLDDDKSDVDKILKNIFFPLRRESSTSGSRKTTTKKRYFLKFRKGFGEKLFDILHKDFSTKIFKSDSEFEENISIENKETLLKIISKHVKKLKIGRKISPQFAEYLVRLEAHMILENQKAWFIPKDNTELIKCFNQDSDEILNKSAFVEIREEDYEDIKSFLSKLNNLSENDFDSDDDSESENKK